MTETILKKGIVNSLERSCPICEAVMEEQKLTTYYKSKWFWQKHAKVTEQVTEEYSCPLCRQYAESFIQTHVYDEVKEERKR